MTRTMKRLAAIGLIASAAFGAQTAHAVTADTTIEIDFPTILVLYHYDTITLNVTEADLAAALGVVTVGGTCVGNYCVELAGPGVAWDMTATAVDAGINVDPGTGPLTPLATVNLEIDNAWGVRSIGAGVLNASVAGNDLTNGTDTLLVTMAGAGAAGTNDVLPAPGLALATGDIDFDIDLSALGSSGTYSGVFTITVTNP